MWIDDSIVQKPNGVQKKQIVNSRLQHCQYIQGIRGIVYLSQVVFELLLKSKGGVLRLEWLSWRENVFSDGLPRSNLLSNPLVCGQVMQEAEHLQESQTRLWGLGIVVLTTSLTWSSESIQENNCSKWLESAVSKTDSPWFRGRKD